MNMGFRMVFAMFMVEIPVSVSLLGPIGKAETSRVRDEQTPRTVWTMTDPVEFEKMNSAVVPFYGRGDHHAEIEIDCKDRTLTVPTEAIVLRKKGGSVMICHSEKAGSSTIKRIVQLLLTGMITSPPATAEYISQFEVHSLVKAGRGHELCNVNFSMAIVRNPFDRLRSGYTDKVNRVTTVPGKLHATFGDFVHALKSVEASKLNVHWMPIATHCAARGPNRYHYNKMYRMETSLGKAIKKAFGMLGYNSTEIKAALDLVGEVNRNVVDTHDLAARHAFYQHQPHDLKTLINEMYIDDIAMGNYTYDDFP